MERGDRELPGTKVRVNWGSCLPNPEGESIWPSQEWGGRLWYKAKCPPFCTYMVFICAWLCSELVRPLWGGRRTTGQPGKRQGRGRRWAPSLLPFQGMLAGSPPFLAQPCVSPPTQGSGAQLGCPRGRGEMSLFHPLDCHIELVTFF